MDIESFERSVGMEAKPPGELDLALQALWWAAKGDWERAHDLCQEASSPAGDWVHAYLHRQEGDLGNARYWYQRAGKPMFDGDLEAEWREVSKALLAG